MSQAIPLSRKNKNPATPIFFSHILLRALASPVCFIACLLSRNLIVIKLFQNGVDVDIQTLGDGRAQFRIGAEEVA